MMPQIRPNSAQVRLPGSINRHLICRTAGLPTHVLDELRAVESANAYNALAELMRETGSLGSEISDALFAAIDGEERQTLRRALLRLKRDAHNGRPLRATDLDTARPELEPSLIDRLERYRDLIEQARSAQDSAHRAFADELVRLRRRFQQAVGHGDFVKGLLLSSLTLSDNVSRYVRASAEKPGSKARQIERSLMRYFSRAVMKATPFSTFCSLLPGELRQGTEPTFDHDPGEKRGRLRLNKTLYALLLPHLMDRPSIRRHIPVELNPTLQDEGQGRLFLTARGRQEVFQRMAANPIVDLLREHLQRQGPLAWQALVDLLCEHPDIEAEPAQSQAYVDKLLDIGLLRFRMGIPEQEVDWDGPLKAFLEPLDDPVARRMVDFLDQLRSTVDAYGRAAASERRPHLLRATSLVSSLFKELNPEHMDVDAPPFYEDAGGPAGLSVDLGSTADALLDYVRLSSRLAWPRSEQANMRHFFDTHYGPDHGPLPLLRFYEDYFREHFKEHLLRQQGFQPIAQNEGDQGDELENPEAYSIFNPFGLDFLDALDQGHHRITRRMQTLWSQNPDADELVLSRQDLESGVAQLPPLPDDPLSVSFFVQYVHNARSDGDPVLVARTYLAGYGKYFSRFLYLLPDNTLRGLQANNEAMARDLDLAEICGDANFNANLHPPLLPKELSYPTGESGSQNQILSSDVWVERDPRTPHRLRLTHGEGGRTIIPVDLGFLNPRLRPPLFQLLSRFTPALNFNLPMPDSPTALHDDRLPEPRYRPRITYEGKLVLARRQWQISHEHFPHRKPHEDDAGYFFRVQAWRRDLGLPQEVFVRIKPLPGGAGSKDGQDRPMRQHLYKPQYLDFHNPFLVDLFSRTGETVERFVCTFEERLPAHEHLLGHDHERYATELIVQADFPDGPGP